MMIEISLLFHSETFRVPKWDMLKECKYIANIKGLMAPPENAAADDSEEEGGGDATFETVFFRNFLVLPPFLAHTLMDSGSRDPCELIIEAMNTFPLLTQDMRKMKIYQMPKMPWPISFSSFENLATLTGHPLFTNNA
eukprot:scaffold245620_cov48-Attheya_sp.AAC.1